MEAESPLRMLVNVRILKIALAVVVTIGSLAWAIVLLGAAWQDLVDRRGELSWTFLAIGTVLVATGSGFMFAAFSVLVRAFRVSAANWLALAHMYYVSQLLKHLPGRIWGLGYQWVAAGRDGSLSGWLLVNAGHMALGLYFAIWSAATVIGLHNSWEFGLVVLGAGIAGYFIAWELCSSTKVAQFLSALPGRIGPIGAGIPATVRGTPRAARLTVLAFLAVGWIAHYTGWWFYGLSYPQLGGWPAVQLCACYMLAWIAGYASIITPSGLGVRELVFLWLAKDYPGDIVALMAIVGRVSLLIVDISFGAAFAPFLPKRQRSEQA